MTRSVLKTPRAAAAFGLLVYQLLIALFFPANAQTACPGGAPAGSAVCYPDSVKGDYSGIGNSNRQPRWKDSWGAFAADPQKAIIGVAEDQSSKRRAFKAAIAACKRHGGLDCTVSYSYKNACAAVTQPLVSQADGRVIYRWGSGKEEVTQESLTECSEVNGGKECDVFYAGCSLPTLVN